MATDTTEETQEQQHSQQEENKPTTPSSTDTLTNKFDKINISLSIWPPTQRTRNAVIDRLIQTLSSPSVLSKRYGSLDPSEASSAARLIEEDAFAIATAAVSSTTTSSSAEPANAEDEVDDGIKILQIYSKEISKRMLEAVKAKAQGSSGSDDSKEADSVVAEPATSEEISSSTEPEST